MKGFILTASWNDQSKYPICLFIKSEGEVYKVLISTQRPLFFVEQGANLPPRLSFTEKKDLTLTSLKNLPMSALYFDSMKSLRQAREQLEQAGVRTYEADVNPVNRYLMERFIHSAIEVEGDAFLDNGVKTFVNPKVQKTQFYPNLTSLSVDIETSMKSDLYSIAQSFHQNDTVQKIVHIIGEGEDTELVKFCSGERELLSEFIKYFNQFDPDLILGWHVAGFDFKVLEEKCMKHGIELNLGRDGKKLTLNSRDNRNYFANIEGRVVLDGPPLLRSNYFRYTNYKLDTVAHELLGVGKDINQTGLEKVAEIDRRFREDKLSLAKYNIMDCTLVYDIYKKLNLFDLLIHRSLMTGLTIDRINTSSGAFDHFYLPRLHRRGFVSANIMDIEEGEASTGGLVLEPVSGFHKNVVVFDFKSLYPSIMRTFFIDPLALERGEDLIKTPMGVSFSKDFNILAPYLDELMTKRAIAKEQNNSSLSHAVKILMNSFYGVLGSFGCRFYHADLPSSITKTGHWVLNQSKDFFENLGHTVIYGDTDSLFVKLSSSLTNEEIEKTGKDLNFYLNRIIKDQYQTQSHLEVEFEKLYSNIFFSAVRGTDIGAKKRYVGDINGKLDFVGMEYVRSDWTKLAKKFQYELYEKIFLNENVESFIKDTIKKLEAGFFDSQLNYNKRFSKPVDEYTKTSPPHVKAARLLPADKQKGLREIEYIMCMNGPRPVEMIGSNDKIDYSHYINKQLEPIAQSVLRFIDLDFESIACGDQLTLF